MGKEQNFEKVNKRLNFIQPSAYFHPREAPFVTKRADFVMSYAPTPGTCFSDWATISAHKKCASNDNMVKSIVGK